MDKKAIAEMDKEVLGGDDDYLDPEYERDYMEARLEMVRNERKQWRVEYRIGRNNRDDKKATEARDKIRQCISTEGFLEEELRKLNRITSKKATLKEVEAG